MKFVQTGKLCKDWIIKDSLFLKILNANICCSYRVSWGNFHSIDGKRRRRLVCVKKPVDLVTDIRFASRILWKFSKKYAALLDFVHSCICILYVVQELFKCNIFSENPQFFQNVD